MDNADRQALPGRSNFKSCGIPLAFAQLCNRLS